VAPPVPQDAIDSEAYASHVPVMPPLQHPLGQVLESQEHKPSVVSQSPFVQAAQAAPPAPQSAADCADASTHVLPLQQPNVHELESHTHWPVVLLHSWPEEQAPQVSPPVPQEVLLSEPYSSHVPVMPPLQQPSGHEVASQTHCPIPLHSWPDGHAAQTAPPEPHEVFDSLVGASHLSLAVQQPGQDVPAQEQAPLVQFSPGAQELHAPPPVPHCVTDWAESEMH
jgi:hypothetical protein